MKWKKMGKIFDVHGQFWWMNSHSSMPSVLNINQSKKRIYFSTRCKENYARIGFFEIDMENPCQITRLSEQPALDIGKKGFFDDSGVYPGNFLCQNDGSLIMYYSGRNNGCGPLYYMSIGILEGNVLSGDLKRKYRYPVISRSPASPWMSSTPCVIKKNKTYYMFYLSGNGWNKNLTKSFYDIKRAKSLDGVNWRFEIEPTICLKKNESNIAAPSIVYYKNKYLMFFSYVEGNNYYKIGCAKSLDLKKWTRLDFLDGLRFGPDDWDSECMAYPHAFIYDNTLYLLYSGNQNGLGGIGLAKYEE